MKIKKIFQPIAVVGKILNAKSASNKQDTYSCDYINNQLAVIVESGSNANGSWTKWSDGTMICRQKIETGTVNINISWGNVYVYSQNGVDYNFPQEFIEEPILSVSPGNCHTAYGYWLGDYGNRVVTKSYWRGWCLMRPTSCEVSTSLHVIAIGRWK